MATGTIKNMLGSIVPSSDTRYDLFLHFATVKDGSYWYAESIFIPYGYKLEADSDSQTWMTTNNVTMKRSGCFYYFSTSNSSLSGKGTNIRVYVKPDI